MKDQLIIFVIFTYLLSICAISAYSQTAADTKTPSPPKIVFNNYSERHQTLKKDAMDRIIDPILCEIEKPIEEIIVDFCPLILGEDEKERGCDNEAQGKLTISVTVNRFDGASSVKWIKRNKEGGFDREEYLGFFARERGSRAPKEGCASKDKSSGKWSFLVGYLIR